jgi:hypothetical protein
LPLVTNGNAYVKEDPVPTVTPSNPQINAALSVPSALPVSTAVLTVGQANDTPHLYIGDPVNHRVLDLAASEMTATPTPAPTGTTAATSGVKLQLIQQYVSSKDLSQVKSLAADPQGKELTVLSQKTLSMASLVSINTGTQTGCVP